MSTSDNEVKASQADVDCVKGFTVIAALVMVAILGTVGIVSWSNVEQTKLRNQQPASITCVSTDRDRPMRVIESHTCEVNR